MERLLFPIHSQAMSRMKTIEYSVGRMRANYFLLNLGNSIPLLVTCLPECRERGGGNEYKLPSTTYDHELLALITFIEGIRFFSMRAAGA